MRVEIDGRRIDLTNLDKPLYPDGFTKAEVVDYYTRIAPVLLPHLAARPLTRIRFPDGTATAASSRRTPPPRPRLGAPDRRRAHHVHRDRDPGLARQPGRARTAHPAVAGRLADPPRHDRLRPGPRPAAPGWTSAARWPWRCRDRLAVDGRLAFAKTSGTQGHAGQRRLGRTPTRRRPTCDGSRRSSRPPRRHRSPTGWPWPAHRQGLHRLEPEQPVEDHRDRLLPARHRPRPHRLHTTDLGRGRFR